MVALINASSEQARALSHSLMPLEVQDNELTEGLRHLTERQETMTPDVTCSLEAGAGVPALRGEIAAHLYRVASEAVSNAIKHADPGRVAIRLGVDGDRLELTVRDDGRRLPDDLDETAGLGIGVMKYRSELIGAELDVGPAEGGGTLVRCRLPLEHLRTGNPVQCRRQWRVAPCDEAPYRQWVHRFIEPVIELICECRSVMTGRTLVHVEGRPLSAKDRGRLRRALRRADQAIVATIYPEPQRPQDLTISPLGRIHTPTLEEVMLKERSS